jgi:hypothetical protein
MLRGRKTIMTGISGVPRARSYYESYLRNVQSSAGAFQPTAGGKEARTAISSGTGFGVSSQPVSAPSLLVAVQESNLSGAEADGDTPSGLFSVKEKDSQDTLIDEILEKGIVEWAHEKWVEKIREKARAEALSSMGLTEDDLAAMPADMRQRIEKKIEEIVEAAIEAATDKAAEETAEKQSGGGVVLSPIITGG